MQLINYVVLTGLDDYGLSKVEACLLSLQSTRTILTCKRLLRFARSDKNKKAADERFSTNGLISTAYRTLLRKNRWITVDFKDFYNRIERLLSQRSLRNDGMAAKRTWGIANASPVIINNNISKI